MCIQVENESEKKLVIAIRAIGSEVMDLPRGRLKKGGIRAEGGHHEDDVVG